MTAEQILPVMIGTAGHVDHGKTSLVRHLTGRETDTHPEEKQRGMSIDLGVVPCPLPDGSIVGLIDVPGHEDFIRNMVAGASSVDVLLLIIAADDAVMPQTREHLTIARALGMVTPIVVLTKVDLVTSDLLDLVREEVQAFVASVGYADAPILPVSNLSGEGIGAVREALASAVRQVQRSEDRRAFRMDVRSVYQLKGLGTVATGVPRSGILRVGETVELLPGHRLSVIRSVQNYRRETSETRAHISSALNVRDLSTEEVHRGMTLAAPGVYQDCSRAVVSVRNISVAQTLLKRTVLRMHCGTAAVTVSLRLLDCDELAPGRSGFASLLIETPIVLSADDPFILRSVSPSETVAGGRVVSVSPFRVKKVHEQLLERLIQAEELLNAGDSFGAEILASPQAVYREEELRLLTRLTADEAVSAVSEKHRSGILRSLGGGWLVNAKADDLRAALKRVLTRYHLINPYVWGMKPELVCEQLRLPATCAAGLIKFFAEHEDFSEKYGRLALASFQPQISQREIKVRDDVLREIHRAGAASVARGNLLESLKVTPTELKFVTKLLVDENQIVILGSSFLLREVYESCRKQLLDLFREHREVEINQFRERTGTSRNLGSAILDSFDAEGMTRRTESGRVLVERSKR